MGPDCLWILPQGHSVIGFSTLKSGNLARHYNDSGFKIWFELIFFFCSWRNQTWAQSFSQTRLLRTMEDKAWFVFVKLPNRRVTPQLNGLIYLSAHVWEIQTETVSILPINLLLVFFFFFLHLSSHSCLNVERKAQHPSVEQTQSRTLEEVRWTTMPPFSLQKHRHHNLARRPFGFCSPSLPRVHSPRLRSAPRFNVEPLDEDLSFLPRRKN